MMNKYIYICILVSFVFFSGRYAASQEISHYDTSQYKPGASSGHYHYVEIKGHSGAHPNSSKYIQDLLGQGYTAIELRVGTQATGRQLWQRVHSYPQYGVGFYSGFMKDDALDTVVGAPSALFGFIGIPIWRKGIFRFNTDLSVGLSYDFEPYDAQNNPYNDVIGSWLNVYFNLNFGAYFKISERMDMSAGFDVTHFSNGRWRSPNKGMNLMGLNLGLAYHFSPMNTFVPKESDIERYPVRAEFIEEPIPELEKYSEINIFGTIGTSTTYGPSEDLAGPRYFNSSWGADYARRFWWRGKVVAGVDVFYDGSLAEGYDKPQSDVSVLERMSFGAHIGHDLLIERFTLVTQFGYYLYKKSSERGSWYLRAGGKIAINEKWAAHICLKTMNGGIADWIEWGMVYSIRLKEK